MASSSSSTDDEPIFKKRKTLPQPYDDDRLQQYLDLYELIFSGYDEHGDPDVMALWGVKIKTSLDQDYPNNSFSDVSLSSVTSGRYPISLKDIIKSREEIKYDLQSESDGNLQQIFDQILKVIKYEKSKKALKSAKNYNKCEGDLQAYISHHLFQLLNPKVLNCSNCAVFCPKCGRHVPFGKTCVGNADATLHGELDMVVGTNTAVHFVTDESPTDSPGGEHTNVEFNSGTSFSARDHTQAIAQTFVFGFVQTNRHPEKDIALPKTILLNSKHFQLYFYDVASDVLLKSRKHVIYSPQNILILGILVNFRHFYKKDRLSSITPCGFQSKLAKTGLLDRYVRLRNYWESCKAKPCHAETLVAARLEVTDNKAPDAKRVSKELGAGDHLK